MRGAPSWRSSRRNTTAAGQWRAHTSGRLEPLGLQPARPPCGAPARAPCEPPCKGARCCRFHPITSQAGRQRLHTAEEPLVGGVWRRRFSKRSSLPARAPRATGPRRAGCAGRREVPPGHPRTRASGLSVPAGRRGLQPQGARVRAPDDPHRREAPPLPSTATEGPSRAACAARPPWARPPSSCTAGSTRERNPNRAGGVARPSVRHQPARTAHRRIRTGRGPASAGRAAGPSGALGTSPAPRRPTGPEGACLPPESPPLSIG